MSIVLRFAQQNAPFHFSVQDAEDHTIYTDSNGTAEQPSQGFRPMQLLLAALGSCSAIDLVSILQKQRQPLTHLALEVHGERATGELPALWVKAHVVFILRGAVQPERAAHAAELSMLKYCSVAETLRRAGCAISWELRFEEA